MKQKTKLIIVLAIEFVAISIVLLMIFFAGKKSYTVTFDLDGGILLSGEEVQRVTQGQNATPPNVAKDGHYLLGWSGNYRKVTSDSTVKAIWEYETTPGIIYSDSENQNYCEIEGSYKELRGEVYIGAYHDEKIVLGISEGAFKDRTEITAMHLLDGILAIEAEAFAGCTKLETIEIPSTVVRIGKGAFANCESLTELILPDDLIEIEEGAFSGCESLEKITFGEKAEIIGSGAFLGCSLLENVALPDSLIEIGALAFSGCDSLLEIVIPEAVKTIGIGAFDTEGLVINLFIKEEDIPDTYALGWYPAGATLVFEYDPPVEESEEDEEDKKTPWWDLGGNDEEDDEKK